MAWVGALVGGAIGILGNVLQNDAQSQAAGDANTVEIELANTAHRREMADLQAAGLNPILTGKFGGSATPQMHVPQLVSPFSGVSSSVMDIFKGLAEEELTREKSKESRQSQRIKEPLSKIGDEASKGVDYIKEGVKGAVESVLDYTIGGKGGAVLGGLRDKGNSLVDNARETLSKGAEAVSASSAKSLERVQEIAKQFGDKAGGVMRLPQKFIGQASASAKEVYDDATKAMKRPAMLDKTVGRNRFVFDENAFSGDRRVDLANIAKIKDPVARNAVRQGYRMWLDNFPQKVK